MKRILCFLLVMFLCAAASAFSQTQANTGKIEGFITDPGGQKSTEVEARVTFGAHSCAASIQEFAPF